MNVFVWNQNMVWIDVTVVVILGFLSFDSFPDFHEFARREIRRWSGVEGTLLSSSMQALRSSDVRNIGHHRDGFALPLQNAIENVGRHRTNAWNTRPTESADVKIHRRTWRKYWKWRKRMELLLWSEWIRCWRLQMRSCWSNKEEERHQCCSRSPPSDVHCRRRKPTMWRRWKYGKFGWLANFWIRKDYRKSMPSSQRRWHVKFC